MEDTTSSPIPEVPSGPRDAAHPRKWWQWLLIYPGIAVSVLGSVPTYTEAVKSYSLGVAFGRSFDAKEQNRLWQENFDCAQKATFATITTKHKVEIGSAVCESGDVLLRGKRPEWDKPQLRWMSWTEVASPGQPDTKKSGWLFELLGTAHAAGAELLLAQASVICQRWVGNGLLLQRIGTPTGCFDQVINTYNGLVVSSRPAPCLPNC